MSANGGNGGGSYSRGGGGGGGGRISVRCDNVNKFNITQDAWGGQCCLSCIMRKLILGVSTRSDTDHAVQPQKMARGLKFRLRK